MRFLLLLLYQKKYMTMLVGLGMGVVYMLVDYGVFQLICHSRSISDGHSLFWVLLWMSMSYGFTNFTWIWLCLSKDEHLPEWSLLILSWWFCCPLLTQTFVLNAVPIVIQRTTGAYHGYMALILFVGYLGAIVYDLRQQQKEQRINLPWLLSIGVLVQFGWEAALFVRGDPQRGLCHGRRKAPYARRQFASGNQSGNAICVRSLYRVFPPLYGAARQTRGTAFFLGTDCGEQSTAAEEASLRTVFSALHQTDQKEGLSL